MGEECRDRGVTGGKETEGGNREGSDLFLVGW